MPPKVITGSESHHNLVRQRIVCHIAENCKAFSVLLPESTGNENEHVDACARYLSTSKMANGATWGSDIEILAAAHLLKTRIFVYTMHGSDWQWVEHGMELTEPGRKACKDSIYLMHTGLVHYDLVETVRHKSDATKDSNPISAAPIERGSEKMKNRSPHSRAYSVPYACSRHQCTARPRSANRVSNSSSSSNSILSDSSFADSVTSSISHTSTSAETKRRQRPGVSTTWGKRELSPRGRIYTYNNNCLKSKLVTLSSDEKSFCDSVRSASKHISVCKYNKNHACKQVLALDILHIHSSNWKMEQFPGKRDTNRTEQKAPQKTIAKRKKTIFNPCSKRCGETRSFAISDSSKKSITHEDRKEAAKPS
ncbi:ATP-dependent DNA helicase [Plakobranchus ocellatus]|uniref:ATP-dependent DNA helicase n=1 Tax=Plakobranchus ocellatus TaxID=259542 RepID=A0AAV3ZMP1_9GAST|nr:ATP-dependent DNA helicase [Plakobranchus ocellatus]